ncbi:MAG: sporulation protein YqfC [Bacillota bacterium]|jgi:sporulation protein YqfC|nr:sporulation protein YqfC [Bacillota bacterium]
MGEKGGILLPRERKKRFEYALAHFLELPKDLVMDLPRVTLVGDMQVIVENHRGIIEYTRERVRISTSLGELIISGTGLALSTIFPEEIAVEGKIQGLTLGG